LWHSQPEELLCTVEGKVWEWLIPSADLLVAQQQHLVSSAIRRSDGVHTRVVADVPPGPDARPVPPTLEDAYLYRLSDHQGEGEV
jgi:hypothetical protein